MPIVNRLTPIDDQDSRRVFEALANLNARIAVCGSKRRADIETRPAAIAVITAFDRYYSGETTVGDLCARLDETLPLEAI